MLKEIIGKLDYSDYDEIALVLFGLCFFAICFGAWMLRKDSAKAFGRIPLEDLVPVSRTVVTTKNKAADQESHKHSNGERQ